MDELVTANELATRLRVRPATIRLWTREGIVPAIRITGKIIRYDPAEVIETLRRQSVTRVRTTEEKLCPR